MNKYLTSILLLTLLLSSSFTSIGFKNTSANKETSIEGKNYNIKPAFGIRSFYVHRWGIRTFHTQYDVRDSNISQFIDYIDEILNALDGGRFSIILGKNYPTKKLVYISPIVMIGKDLELNLSSVTSGLLDGYIVFRKGDAIPLALLLNNNLTMPLLSITPFSQFSSLLSNSLVFNISKMLVIPYNYSTTSIFPPAPLLDPNNLGLYSSFWNAISLFLEGFGGYVSSGDDRIDFYLFGENDSLFSNDNTTLGITINSIFSYDRDTGVEISAYVNATINVFDDKGHLLSYQFELALSYMGGEELNLNLDDGDKLGYRVTNFGFSNSTLDFLDALQREGVLNNSTFNISDIRSALDLFEKINVTFTYNSNNSRNGIDLAFDSQIDIPSLNFSLSNITIFNTTILLDPISMLNQTVFNTLIPGSIYLLGAWEESAALIQTVNTFFTWSYIFNVPFFNVSIKLVVTRETRFFKHLNGNETDYYAYQTNVFIRYVQPEIKINNTLIPPIKAKVNLSNWFIYDSKGYLVEKACLLNITEIEIQLTKGVKLVFEGLTNELKINAVKNVNGEPNFNTIRKPPTFPSKDWINNSLYKPNTTVGAVSDNMPPEIHEFKVNVYYNATGTFIEFKANISDESPILLVKVNYNSSEFNINGSLKLKYNSEEKLWIGRVYIDKRIKKAFLELEASDIFHNFASYNYKLNETGGREANQFLVFIVAVVLMIGITGIIIYFRRGD